MTCYADQQTMEFDLVECIVEHPSSTRSSDVSSDVSSSSLESDDNAPIIVFSGSRSGNLKM